jgi:hypothetical protein
MEVKVNKIMFEKLTVKEQKETAAGLSNPSPQMLTVTYYCLYLQ